MTTTTKRPQPLTLAATTIERIIKDNGYTFSLQLGGEPDKLLVHKDNILITSVGFDITRELLLNNNYTFSLYLNRQTSNQLKIDKFTSKTYLQMSVGRIGRIRDEHRKDTTIIFKLLYYRAIRVAIQQSPELRKLFN